MPATTPDALRDVRRQQRFAEWRKEVAPLWNGGPSYHVLLFRGVLTRYRQRSHNRTWVDVSAEEVADLYEFAASVGRLALFEAELEAVETGEE